MGNYDFSKRDILQKFKDENELILRGKELRTKGYKCHWHMIWGNSIEIPSSGELFGETEMKVRYDHYANPQELEEAFEYLVLCEEKLEKISNHDRGFSLS